MANLTRFNWLAWHRRLGLITCIGILMWAVSGFSHPIMTHLQPAPVAFMPPAQSVKLADAVTINQVLTEHTIDQVRRIALLSMGNQSYYRISADSNLPARYFSVQTGRELPDGDQLYFDNTDKICTL